MNNKMKTTYSLLHAICEGTMGYIIYLSRCKLFSTLSELSFYPIIGQIANSHGWDTHCQYRLEKTSKPGANRTIDFKLNKGTNTIGLEIKWVPDRRNKRAVDIKNEIEKLKELLSIGVIQSGFILLLGKPKMKKQPSDLIDLSKLIRSVFNKSIKYTYDKTIKISRISVGASLLRVG